MKKTASGYRLIFGYLGLFIGFVGFATLVPLLAIFAYPEEAGDWYCFFIPGMASIIVGNLMFILLIARRMKAQLGKHQDSILLLLIWITAIFISATPYLIKGCFNFTDAMFETTSAYATVGLTVFKTQHYNLHLFILYRSIICFIGGIGLVLIVTSAISDRYGLKLYMAEGHNDKLMPNLARSARVMLSIYAGLIALGTILYALCGMNALDAFVHSVSAIATAGFSSKEAGLMAYAGQSNFWLIELISVVLMVLGATNFMLHLFIITGKWKKVWKDCEVRLFLILSLIFIPLFVVAALTAASGVSFGQAFSTGSFTFISAITTTGFSNVSNVMTLGQGTLLLVVLINVIGGGMGSTAGGVKLYRFVIALKSLYWSTKESVSSANVIYPHYVNRLGKEKEISSKEIADALAYIMIYVLLMLFGSLLVALFSRAEGHLGANYGESLFEFSNALACTGLTCGVTQAGTIGVKWTLIFGMFAGRLEILVIYFGLFRIGRDILRKETT